MIENATHNGDMCSFYDPGWTRFAYFSSTCQLNLVIAFSVGLVSTWERLSHQKTINKNNFCLLDLTVDTFFRDSILPLVYFLRSPYDCIQSLIKTYELKVTFLYFFLPKKTSKISKIYKIESLTHF